MKEIPIFIAAAGLLLITVKWAFFHGRRLPRHRVRLLRIRLRLRLHPGKGLATIIELWWRWGRLAMLRHSSRTRPGLTFAQRLLSPAAAYSVLAGRAHYRHALRLPLDEHAVIFSPPRGGKTGWLSRVIAHYPGPVLSTTTKHDVFELTSGIRAQRGPVHVFNPQGIGAVPSTFRWNPLAGCQDPRSRSAAPTRSPTRSARRASKTPPSGPPKPPTTCAATSTPPRSPAWTCATWHAGSPASAPKKQKKSFTQRPLRRTISPSSSRKCGAKRTRPSPPCG